MKRKRLVFAGIDPGLGGALVLLDENGHLLSEHRMPTLQTGGSRRVLDRTTLIFWLKGWAPTAVGVELVRVQGVNGRLACYSIGEAMGTFRTLCLCLELPMIEVPPKTWQKLLDGKPKGRDAVKVASAESARARWPGLTIRLKADWGRADAAWIAETARRSILLPSGG